MTWVHGALRARRCRTANRRFIFWVERFEPKHLKSRFLAKPFKSKDSGMWAVKHPRGKTLQRTQPTNPEL